MGAVMAAMIRAIRASGAIVRIEPADFSRLLQRQEAPLVLHATRGLLRTRHQYLSAYKGLIFHTKTAEPLALPGSAELVETRSIWVP